jgi:hypothetical protein
MEVTITMPCDEKATFRVDSNITAIYQQRTITWQCPIHPGETVQVVLSDN